MKTLFTIVAMFAFSILQSPVVEAGCKYRSANVPQELAPKYRRKLENTLERMCCRIKKHIGVWGDARHIRERPKSCHNVASAIDIVRIECEDGDNSLRRLAKALPGRSMLSTYLLCYRDLSNRFCLPGHKKHLHFGGREFRKCR